MNLLCTKLLKLSVLLLSFENKSTKTPHEALEKITNLRSNSPIKWLHFMIGVKILKGRASISKIFSKTLFLYLLTRVLHLHAINLKVSAKKFVSELFSRLKGGYSRLVLGRVRENYLIDVWYVYYGIEHGVKRGYFIVKRCLDTQVCSFCFKNY